MLISSLLSTSPVNAQTQLDKCDAALNAKISEAYLCSIGLDYRNKELERLYKENEALRSKGTGLFDNPAVWATVGLVVGAFAVSRISK